MGNQPFVVPSFSGRGPTVYGGLKPDVVAPGVHILSQGFGIGSLDSEKHLGFGQETGTSMAAPFVAGAVALLMEKHPNWTSEMIFSALMSTAQIEGIYNRNGSLAQPTDMGSGLVDVEKALNPGAFLLPPKISFGRIRSLEGLRTQELEVVNAGDQPLSLELSAEKLANSGREALHAFKIEPQNLTLPPRGSSSIKVSLQPGPSDPKHGYLQGYLILRGGIQELHVPLFAWLDLPSPTPEFLLLDADLSPMHPDYSPWYMTALDDLGVEFGYWNAAQMELKVPPHVASEEPPKTVLIFTGDGSRPLQTSDGIPVPFAPHEQELLAHYVDQGGSLVVMGRDAASFFATAPLQSYLTGSAESRPSSELTTVSSSLMARSIPEAPDLLKGLSLDLGDYPQPLEKFDLVSQNGLPNQDPVLNDVRANATYAISPFGGALEYTLVIEVPEGTSISDSWFYILEEDSTTRVKDLLPGSDELEVFGVWHWQGRLDLDEKLENARTQGKLHVAVQLTGSRTDILDGTVTSLPLTPLNNTPARPVFSLTSVPLTSGRSQFLTYKANNHAGQELAAVASDFSEDSLSLAARGKTVFVSFGLEKIRETETNTTRVEFLKQILAFLEGKSASTE